MLDKNAVEQELQTIERMLCKMPGASEPTDLEQQIKSATYCIADAYHARIGARESFVTQRFGILDMYVCVRVTRGEGNANGPNSEWNIWDQCQITYGDNYGETRVNWISCGNRAGLAAVLGTVLARAIERYQAAN